MQLVKITAGVLQELIKDLPPETEILIEDIGSDDFYNDPINPGPSQKVDNLTHATFIGEGKSVAQVLEASSPVQGSIELLVENRSYYKQEYNSLS